MRSIKLFNIICRGDEIISSFDIEIIASYLTPQSILYNLLKDRISKKHEKKLHALIKQVTNGYFEKINIRDYDCAISNLFILALDIKGKKSRISTYTALMKEIFCFKENEIHNLRLIDLPHELGVTFNFSDLVIYNSKIQGYSRFFDCTFNIGTYFWGNCILSNLESDTTGLSPISCTTQNFDEEINGDGTHLNVLLKKDSNYSISTSGSMNSIKNIVSALIFIENRSNFTKFGVKTYYLRDRKFTVEDFDLVFNKFLEHRIILNNKENFSLNRNHMDELSKFYDNSYMSRIIRVIFTELKEHYS